MMMNMNSMWGWGLLLFGSLVAVGALYYVRYLVHARLRKQPDDTTGKDDRGSPALTEASLYRLAKQHRGRLTVSDVVIAAGTSTSAAERALDSIADGNRVTVEITDHGSIEYEFAELTEPQLQGKSTNQDYLTTD